jgi:hypothetical protein
VRRRKRVTPVSLQLLKRLTLLAVHETFRTVQVRGGTSMTPGELPRQIVRPLNLGVVFGEAPGDLLLPLPLGCLGLPLDRGRFLLLILPDAMAQTRRRRRFEVRLLLELAPLYFVPRLARLRLPGRAQSPESPRGIARPAQHP